MTSTTPEHVAPATRAAPGATATWLALLAVAAAAWVGIVVWAVQMGNGTGTMGLSALAFLAMWALMMTAMMLPTAAVAAGASGQPLPFAVGYLLVWAATGVPALGAAVAAGHLASDDPDAAKAAAVVILAVAGLYQLSRPKRRSVGHCRAVVAGGRTVGTGLRAGAGYAGWCLQCSWAAMALMIVFGVMSVPTIVLVAIVLYAERHWVHGRAVGQLAGVAALVVAALVVVWPSVAAGLHATAHGMAHM
jgi:predicted metal-binding membrane protein